MKKYIKIMSIAVIFLLSSCKNNNKIDYGDSYYPDQDAQTFTVIKTGAYVDNGFYAVNDETNNIDFIDCVNKRAVPLCNKPECKHNDKSCNAHFDDPSDVIIYNGNIYVVACGEKDFTATSLYKMSIDGSERIELRTLFRTEDESDASVSPNFIIHRGYGYLVINWFDNNLSHKRKQAIYRISLDGKDKKELYSIEGYQPIIQMFFVSGNNIYFNVSCFDKSDYINPVSSDYRLDIMTGEVTEIIIPDNHNMIVEKDKKIYTMNRNGNSISVFSMSRYGGSKKEIYCYDNSMPLIFRDRNYLYWDNQIYIYVNDIKDITRDIKVMDYEGNIVCDIVDMGMDKNIVWSDTENILFYNYTNHSYSIYSIKNGQEVLIDTYQI